MPAIKLIDKRPREPHRHNKVFQIFGQIGIHVRKVHDGRGVYFAVVEEKQIEEILKDENQNVLINEGFQPVPPIEYSSLKTIVVRNIDRMIDSFDDDEVTDSINRLNDWAEVESIFRIPSTSKLLKVKFKQQQMVETALKKGIIVLHQHIPASNVEREIFIKLNFCRNCFSYNHLTRQCEAEKKKRCSFCAKEHYYTECQETEPQCINCGGRHRTLAAVCQIRKDLIKERSKNKREMSRSVTRQRAYTSYAAAAATGTSGTATGNIIPGISKTEMKQIITKIMSSIVYSHYVEALTPGSFQENMNKMYQMNGLNPMNFPTPPMTGAVIEACKEAFNIHEQTEIIDEQKDKSDDLVFDNTEEIMLDEQEQIDQILKRARDTLTPPATQDKRPRTETDSSRKPPFPPTKKTQPGVTQKQRIISPKDQKSRHVVAQPQPHRQQPPKLRGRVTERKEFPLQKSSSRESSLEVEGDARSRCSSVSSAGIGDVDVPTKKILMECKKTTRECGITVYVAKSSEIDIRPEYFTRFELSTEIANGNAKITWKNPKVELDKLLKAFAENRIDMFELTCKRISDEDYSKLISRCIGGR